MKKGFTLIELLVVIAIIALLLSIMAPSLRHARELARRIVCGTHMRSLTLAMFIYADEEADQLPPMVNRENRSQARVHNHLGRNWFVSGSGSDVVSEANGSFWNLGVLWQTGRIDVGEVFYCTSMNVHEDYRWAYYSEPVFPTAKPPNYNSGNVAVRCSYSYNPECVGNATEAERVMRFTRKTVMPSTAVLLADNISSQGAPHNRGWNVAYGDGSVSYFRSDELQEMIRETPGFNMSGPEAWAAWDSIIFQMKGR